MIHLVTHLGRKKVGVDIVGHHQGQDQKEGHDQDQIQNLVQNVEGEFNFRISN